MSTSRTSHYKLLSILLNFSDIRGDCHLSQLTYNNLLSQDISYDRDSDLFRPLFGGSCGPGYYPDNYNDQPQGEACARIWRSQRRLASPASRDALSSRDLRECEQFCRTASTFTCRSFSFTSSANTYISNNARLQNKQMFDYNPARFYWNIFLRLHIKKYSAYPVIRIFATYFKLTL